LNLFDTVRARFSPKRIDDLIDGVIDWIGFEATWQALWIIEEGPYKGQWAMGVEPKEATRLLEEGLILPFAWVPECDLERL